jgi:uncharacterized protein DUF6340
MGLIKKHIRAIHYLPIAFIGFTLFLNSCSATKEYALNALEPATVDLSTTITKIGIINESTASEKSAYKTRMEQLLSAKNQQLEKEGIEAAIIGLFNELQKDQRFDTIQLIPTEVNESKGLGDTVDAIAWLAIREICDTHGVDAIFSLAYYETDTQVSFKKKVVKEQNMLRQMIKISGHEITLETLIENGWRIYDPYNQKVIDEIVFNEQVTATGQGSNPLYALEDIGDRRETVLEQSTQAGSLYGRRLLPQEKEVVRDYYVRGSNKLVEAKKLVIEGHLEVAADLWKVETTHENDNIKAKACFNMAFYQETQGRYTSALDWAEKAYDHAPSKRAFAYLKILENRIDQSKIVQEQLQRSRLSASVELD